MMVLLKVEQGSCSRAGSKQKFLIMCLSSNSGPEQSTPLGNHLGRELLIYNYINYIPNQPASAYHLCAKDSL